jgi:hypothetical protein
MRSLLLEVTALQKQFSVKATPAMQRRGHLVRREIPAALNGIHHRLAQALGVYGAALEVTGRDGIGSKTYVPWVRFHSHHKSPSAQQGWYCVYLFEASGQGLYLALGHAATTYVDGVFKAKPPEQLVPRLAWARHQLRATLRTDPGLARPMALGGKALAEAYERSMLLARWYPAAAMPEDAALFAEAEHFAGLLHRLYAAEDLEQAGG